MRAALLLLVALMLACGLACVFELRPPTPLSGTYELSGGCLLKVDETSASADCSSSGITVQVSIADEEVTFEKIVVTETEKGTDCWEERTCTRTYSGTATRKSREGTPYDGRFARLAGTWEVKLTQMISCSKEVAKSSAPSYCKKSLTSVTYTSTATVSAHEAKITWSASTGSSGEFKALETKGGVMVADSFYRRVEGQGPDGGWIGAEGQGPDVGGGGEK